MLVAGSEDIAGERGKWATGHKARTLTKPSEGVHNHGWDNYHGHYILRQHDLIHDGSGKRY
jgi:hypothetical protein